MTDCVLCQTVGGNLLWQNDLLRVIDACDPAYPAFTRVIWKAHVAEMTDLAEEDQQTLMRIVLLVEKTQRELLQPDCAGKFTSASENALRQALPVPSEQAV